MHVLGPVIGAAIAVVIIIAVRGRPDKEELAAAEGGGLPMIGTDGPQPPSKAKDPAGGMA